MQQEIRKRDQLLAQAEADMGDLLASKESEKAWFMQAVLYCICLRLLFSDYLYLLNILHVVAPVAAFRADFMRHRYITVL